MSAPLLSWPCVKARLILVLQMINHVGSSFLAEYDLAVASLGHANVI